MQATRKVEHTITIPKDPETVIRAFHDPDLLRGWWGVERSFIILEKGRPYILTWSISDAGFQYVSTGVVETYLEGVELTVGNMVYLNPEKPMLGPMKLTVKATAVEDGTSLYLCQDGYQSGEVWDWYYNAVLEAWPRALSNLRNFLMET